MTSKRRPSLRRRIVAEARSWQGTPFLEQASVKGRGCDCKGLVVGVAREIGLAEAESLHARMCDYDLGRIDPALLKAGLAATLCPVAIDKAKAGDVLLCRVNGSPAHLAFLTEPPPVGPGLRAALDPSPRRSAELQGGKAVHTQIVSRAQVKETELRVLFHFYPLDSVWRFSRCR